MVVVFNEVDAEVGIPQESTNRVDYTLLFDNEQGSDVTFIVGQTDRGEPWRFPGHTQILGMANVRLREMFRSMPPSKSIVISDVDKRGFEYLLRCLYHQPITFSKMETALNALKTALRYQCLPLAEHSVRYIDFNLTISNVLDVFIEIGLPTLPPNAETTLSKIEQYLNQLRHNCLVLIDTETSKVLENERFEDLTREQVEFILRRDTLQPHREYDLWKALERWLDRECKRLQLENTNSMKRKVLGSTENVVRYSLMKKREFLAGPAQILLSNECDEVFRQMKMKEKNPRCGKIEAPFPLSERNKVRRKSNDSQGSRSKVYDFCLTCLVCVFD